MVQLKIISVGTLKEEYLRDAILEYSKRISQFAKIEEINIKEEKINDELDSKEIAAALEKEGEKIIKAAPRDSYRIALCVEGVQYSSEAFSDIIKTASDKSGKISIIIGSSHGLSPLVKNDAHLKLSVSKMTFPHQLMRVIITEAVYRAFTIIKGKRYHK
jgi:23S rRNA (pseudouridine1915-N3)-methyltransferase